MTKKTYWGAILLLEIFFLIFLTGFFPAHWHSLVFPILYSALYLTTVGSLDKNKKEMFGLAVALLVAQSIFNFFDLEVIKGISKALNFLFFSFIVVSFIRQIANAKQVTERVILEAVNGYLLLGIVFTFLIGSMIQYDPSSYNFSQSGDGTLHNSLYYGFITFATLGYGDLVPLKPYTNSCLRTTLCGCYHRLASG